MRIKSVSGLDNPDRALEGCDRRGDDVREKPTVLLYGLKDGCGLIIPHPSGIIFRNQVCGMSCHQAELEGFYLPMSWDGVENAMEEIFHGGRLSAEDADRIDAALAKNAHPSYEVRVDRTRLDQSCEAWVWVTISGDFYFAQNMSVTEAVLTWQNSD
jgi:hypothetical protein